MPVLYDDGTHTKLSEVIPMDRFRSSVSLSPLRQAEAYWNALRQTSSVPRRSQIDPRGLENVLEYAFILERIAPGIARFRLAGQHLCTLAGMEVRGMPLTAFFTPSGRTEISAVLEHVFDTPAVAELTLTGEPQRGKPVTEARMILLPLQSDLGDISRVLGILVAEMPVAKVPFRLDVAASTFRSISQDYVSPHHFDQDTKAKPSSFAEEKVAFDGKPPHLRLIKS